MKAEDLVSYELEKTMSEDTFGEPGVIATRYQKIDGETRKTLRMALKDLTGDLPELERALLAVEAALAMTPSNDNKVPEKVLRRALIQRNLIVRHGKLTVYENENAKTTFFSNDRGYCIEYPGLGPTGTEFLSIAILPPIPWLPPLSVETRDEEDMTVFMEENVLGPGPMEHWYSPFSNFFGLLWPFWDYLEGFDDFCDEIDDLDSDECIKELRVHSHGNLGTIRMGSENITFSDFDAAGNPKPGKLKDWLDKLKQKMCNPSEIIFDACGQGNGSMLQNMSNYLGSNVTVSGFSGTGNPFTGGDLHF